ncbi:hypothetical protein JFY65_03245 [Porphyromonas gingivalis]|uniref:Terminase LSU n=2 Tax=Viruses TaxID=10239 RepID=A0AAT9J8C1_9VIRU|nr:hypothetical protein [Porphyromonas gingivalis]MCE8193187.1 hypothetical protein [Porphyromonas gingivalis]
MAKRRLSVEDRHALKSWEEIVAAIKESSDINPADTQAEIAVRKKRLEADHEAWFRYYFEAYYSSDPAPFHIRSAKRFFDNRRLYDVRAWSRELSKTSTTMMQVTKAALTGEIRNVLYISNSYDNAEKMLNHIMANMEANQRIIQDYGEQKTIGLWESGDFVCRCGCAFLALGAGQSPRGTKNKNFRPDCIVFDDIDTDEECRNPDRIKIKWKWIEEATIPAMSVSGSYRIIFNGNIIANDCCIARAIEKAKQIPQIGHYEIINIRDKNGRSVWARNSEEDIDMFLSLISTAAGQKEFFNNPLSEGEVFTEMHWGKCPPLQKLQYLVSYGDPAPSNSKNKATSFKANFLVGFLDGYFYVYTGFLDRVANAEFVNWYYYTREYVGEKQQIRYFIENNTLQDPFYQQVFIPLFTAAGMERGVIPISPDERKKPEKFDRIEGNLEPLNRQGRLILNIDEKDNPHMKRLEEQFLCLSRAMKAPADGPDTVEGAWYKINEMLQRMINGSITVGARQHSKKRI